MTVSSDRSIERPTIESIEQAEMWIGVHHAWGIKDAERMNRIEDRLARLEQPWWRRLLFGRRPW